MFPEAPLEQIFQTASYAARRVHLETQSQCRHSVSLLSVRSVMEAHESCLFVLGIVLNHNVDGTSSAHTEHVRRSESPYRHGPCLANSAFPARPRPSHRREWRSGHLDFLLGQLDSFSRPIARRTSTLVFPCSVLPVGSHSHSIDRVATCFTLSRSRQYEEASNSIPCKRPRSTGQQTLQEPGRALPSLPLHPGHRVPAVVVTAVQREKAFKIRPAH
ncbi:hypothetical protein HDV57DRAFT_487730 [Trichoderma longibrachiatum]